MPAFSLRDRWMSYMTTKRKLVPLSIVRIAYGLLLLVYFAKLYPDRDFLFSNGVGYYPAEYINTRSDLLRHGLRLFDSYAFLDALFLIGLVSAVTFTVGFWTKTSHVFLLGSYFMLGGRNPLLFDAGDDFARLALIYLLFCQMNACFSVDGLLARRKKAKGGSGGYFSIVHNLGMIAAVAQFLMIYVLSGLAKLAGHHWRDGSALYYISQADFYRMMDGVGNLVVAQPWLSDVLTYSVVVFQMAFAVLVFVKRARSWTLLVACCFHIGIAAQMGLVYFSLIMISFDIMFFTDEECRRMLRLGRFSATADRREVNGEYG